MSHVSEDNYQENTDLLNKSLLCGRSRRCNAAEQHFYQAVAVMKEIMRNDSILYGMLL